MKFFKTYSKRILISSLAVALSVIITVNHAFKAVQVSANTNIPYIWKEIETEKKDFIKWIDFNVCFDALDAAYRLDVNSYETDYHYNWIELLALLACKYGNDFNKYSKKDLDSFAKQIKEAGGVSSVAQNMKYYDYYYEAYSAILCEFLGVREDGTYGMKVFLPIANKYSFSHYKDFGSSRSYGFSRTHLGNDLMGSIGTPIIAVETGTIFHLGWNQYGGWRIGIRSLDGKRYYYYAHLRKNHPYVPGLEEGMTINAGDVIGYLGMTGYSIKENVNNINVPHLHFGMQVIFDESQVDSSKEIWIDVYNIVEFLKKNRSSVYMSNTETKDYSRVK